MIGEGQPLRPGGARYPPILRADNDNTPARNCRWSHALAWTDRLSLELQVFPYSRE